MTGIIISSSNMNTEACTGKFGGAARWQGIITSFFKTVNAAASVLRRAFFTVDAGGAQ